MLTNFLTIIATRCIKTMKAMFVENLDIMHPVKFLLKRDQENLEHFRDRVAQHLAIFQNNGKNVSAYMVTDFFEDGEKSA